MLQAELENALQMSMNKEIDEALDELDKSFLANLGIEPKDKKR